MDALIAIVLIVVACVFYTLSLFIGWDEIKYSSLIPLGIAIIADMYGTKLMYDIAGSLTWSFHATIGLLALAGMIILTFIGASLLKKKKNNYSFRITYRILYVTWVISFITGIIEHL